MADLSEDYNSRKYEEDYSVELVEKVRDLFDGSHALTESFFGLHAQFDALIEAHDVFLSDGEHQVQALWTPELVLAAVDEAVMIAKAQNSPAWPALMAIASAMRVMLRTVWIIPQTEFKQDEAEGIPPGLFALLKKEDARPFDFAVAAVSGDLTPDSMIGAAVLAERARCESLVRDRYLDIFGRRDPVAEDLKDSDAWFHEQLERVRSEIACEQPAGEQAESQADQTP